MNVHGSEVTEATVKRQSGYDDTKPITRLDMAKLAFEMMNDDGKRDRARAYLKGLEEDYGHFNAAATKCLIYNSSGANMTFNTYHDWSGHIGESSYPIEIKNGQWGVFFHHKSKYVPANSCGAVVYHLKDVTPDLPAPGNLSCVLGWFSAHGPESNKCYATVTNDPHPNEDYFDVILPHLLRCTDPHYTLGGQGLQVDVTIGGEIVSEWIAIITLLSEKKKPT